MGQLESNVSFTCDFILGGRCCQVLCPLLIVRAGLAVLVMADDIKNLASVMLEVVRILNNWFCVCKNAC